MSDEQSSSDVASNALALMQSALDETDIKSTALDIVDDMHVRELPSRAAAMGSPISQRQMQTLWEVTPEHAIKVRPGPGGRSMAYVSHGYVEFKLNEAFGGDWDFEPMPVFSGSVFHLQQVEATVNNKKVTKYNVAVMCKLTVRVRDHSTLEVLSTIVKVEPGSAEWHAENEFGDALKSATSDALKRCGLRLGIALDLYYNDDREREVKKEQADNARKLAEVLKAEKERKEATSVPSNVPSIIMRVKKQYNVVAADLFTSMYGDGVNVGDGMTRMTNDLNTLGANTLWEQVQRACSSASAIIDQGQDK